MLREIIKRFEENKVEIEAWLQEQRTLVQYHPIYSSVDVRSSGVKVVPVDTNLFPAGWNNLCPKFHARVSKAFRDYFDTFFPGTKCLLVLPEDHTRNLYYLLNLKRLQTILEGAGFEVKIGTLNPDLGDETTLDTAEDEKIVLYKVRRDQDALYVGEKRVCQVIVNNDFSGGVPEILKGIEQHLLPTPLIGWHTRRKIDNFQYYHELIKEFAALIGLDPWLFESRFRLVEEVDFDDAAAREKVALMVDELLKEIADFYLKFGVKTVPSVFIKNNAGTYGMAVIRVNSGDEVRNMNQKLRKQMRAGKGSVGVTSVVLQEGVPTTDRVKDFVAEPVVYLVGNQSIGGFYRLNSEKGDTDNLNSKGMLFESACLRDFGYRNIFDEQLEIEKVAPVYNTIAEISSLAAAYELRALEDGL